MKCFLFILSFFVMSQTIGYSQTLKPVPYSDGNQQLKGLVTSHSSEKLPGVLILPAWKGIDQEAKTAALDLAKEGYIAFIADIYGEGNIPTDNAAAAKLSGQYKSDYKAYQRRIQVALETLIKQGADPTKIAVIGYCFGGTGALEAARGNLPVVGSVCIHGSIAKDPARPNGPIQTKVLIEHPADDASVKPEHLIQLEQELRDGNADWQLITYANSKHTFTNPESKDYNPLMAARAWKHTLLFLSEILK